MARLARGLPLVLLLGSAAAWSNGGPVDWNPPSALGDGAPRAASKVSLIREDLSLRVGEDPNRYTVEARYLLRNPGPPTTVRWGLPISVAEEQEEEGRDAALAKLASGVTIELNGVTTGCKVAPGPGGRVAAPGLSEGEQPEISAWCLTDLSIPTGESIALNLRYQAATRYVDGETSKSARTHFDQRDLIYPLFPAAGWAGTPALNISLDLGPWADDARVLGPTGAKRSGSAWSWSIPQADLRKLVAVAARIDVNPVFGHRQLVATNLAKDNYTIKLKGTASSALAGGSYEAANLFDGKAGTAWCEGVEGDGVGEWVELRVDRASTETYCRVQGLVLVPGYAKSQAVWENNSRVSAVSLGPCGGGEAETIPLTVSRRFDTSALLIELADTGAPGREALAGSLLKDPAKACVRVTLQTVEKGAKYPDTCLSEIAALVNCG